MESEVELRALSETISAIYDCAVDPEKWPAALERTASLVGGKTASIGISDTITRETLIRTTWGVPEPYLSSYATYVASMPFYQMYAAMEVEDAKAGSSMYDMDAFLGSTFYKEWVGPQGLMDVAALCIMNDDRRFGIFGVNTGDERELVGPRDLATLSLLAPHVRRAATISDLLDITALSASRLDSALNTLGNGILLVDRELRVLHANASAGDMLKSEECLAYRSGRLVSRSDATTQSIENAVARAVEADLAIGRLGFGLPAPREKAQPAILHLLPVMHSASRRDLAPTAAAAIFITSPGRSPTAPVDALAALYDLSRAESQVFALAGEGRTQEEMAGKLGLSQSTIKSHLMSIYRKTGLSRQPDLVALFGSLSLSLMPAD